MLPVVEALAGRGIAVSVDTTRAGLAAAAVEAGAGFVNDVSGGLADADMLGTVAAGGADYICMHWRGHSRTMQDLAHYGDVVGEVRSELLARRDAAVAAGIPGERVILDPGIGFAKTAAHNWELLRHADRFEGLGHRVLWGVSRKGFLGAATGRDNPRERDVATAVATFWCALAGAWGVRTHEVQGQLDAVAVATHLAPSGLHRVG